MNSLESRDIERPYYLYRWTNLVNNKIYIGITVNCKQRLHQYKSAANKSTDPISRAHKKYGFNNFKFEIINYFENFYIANEAEVFMIAHFNSRDPNIGYNVTAGGYQFVDAEIGKKIKAGLKRFYDNNVSKMKGFKHTQESRDKLSKSCMGKPGTNKGKKFSEEWKKKISIANTNNPAMIGRIPVNRKLTMDQAREIRKRYSEGEAIRKLCLAFNMSKSTLSKIVKGLSYKEIIKNE